MSMFSNGKEKTRFLPIEKIDSKNKCTIVNDIEDLGWYAKNPQGCFQRKNGIIKSVKKSTGTKIETQTVYFTDLKSGRCGFIQLLYSIVMGGVYKGFQLNFKSFRCSESQENEEEESQADIWESFKLEDVNEFSELKVNSPQVTFAFKKSLDDSVISKLEISVDIATGTNVTGLKIKLLVDIYRGFLINPDGCNYYLDKSLTQSDISKQRKSAISKKVVRHLFVPRVQCRGKISYVNSQNKKIEFRLDKVPGLYIDAVQGLIPYKAATNWNFLCFQSLTTSLLCMEFTTTKEYDRTKVTIWCSTKNNQIEKVGSSINGDDVRFDSTTRDKLTGYECPTQISFPMGFREQHLRLVNRYDIMGEVPSIVRGLAENVAHIKPYLYQYCQKSEYAGEKGISIIESTFISS